MATRVYEYGLLQPTVNGDRVHQQMRLAHKYYNALIEVERARRLAVRAAQSMDSSVAALEAELAPVSLAIDELSASIQKARQATHSARVDPEQRAKLKMLRATAKELRVKLRETKKVARENPELMARLAVIEAESGEKRRAARAACECFWGTYLLVEAAVDAARKSVLDPKFKRWTGDSAIAVQLQKGLQGSLLFGTDTRIRVEPVDLAAWTHPKRGVRRKASRTKLMIRIGSERAKPVWAEFPMIMHRPLPVGAVITWAKVIMRRRCHWQRFFLQLTLNIPDPQTTVNPERVAVDIGWRAVPNGLRVAAWASSDGRQGTLVLPNSIMERVGKAESIRGFRDVGMNEMKAKLSEVVWPEALLERVKTFSAWRSPDRFVGLFRAWTEARFEGDAEPYEVLRAWYHRDKHLWQYETGVRRGALGHRRELYRLFAHRLATLYGHVVFEDFDLRSVAQRGAVEDASQEARAPNRQRTIAATSLLRQICTNAWQRVGGSVLTVNPAHSTKRCHHCGHIETFDAGRAIMHTCDVCREVWDQDINAAINLLAAAELLDIDTTPKPERKARWSKRHAPAPEPAPTPTPTPTPDSTMTNRSDSAQVD